MARTIGPVTTTLASWKVMPRIGQQWAKAPHKILSLFVTQEPTCANVNFLRARAREGISVNAKKSNYARRFAVVAPRDLIHPPATIATIATKGGGQLLKHA